MQGHFLDEGTLRPCSDEQPSLYSLSLGETLEGIFKDLDNKISLPNSVTNSKVVMKLLPYLGIKGRQYYHFEG